MTSNEYNKARRAEVYAVIDGERDYQDAQLGNSKPHTGRPQMSPGEYILCIEKVLQDARETWYKPVTGGIDSMVYLRKAAALCVAAMELYGAPPRG